jgi:TolB-like protein
MTVAVLPFLDLTDSMNAEAFADGMTEELINKLSKVPGLRVQDDVAGEVSSALQRSID